MTIRLATPADYDAALKIIGDAFGLAAIAPTVHTAVADSDCGQLLVATDEDGRIVGTGASVGFGATGWIGGDRALAIEIGLGGGVATLDLSAVALRPPWPALPILARDPYAGAVMLSAVLGPGIRVAVPEANERGVDALLAHGATEGEPVLRMRRGPAVAWRPEELWGVFSLFFG